MRQDGYRILGKTGERVSAIGIGGAHAGRASTPEEATRIIRTAIDNGINFMDNCWDYAGGEAEVRMGNALRGGYRERVFLMTKIDGHLPRLPRSRLTSASSDCGPTSST